MNQSLRISAFIILLVATALWTSGCSEESAADNNDQVTLAESDAAVEETSDTAEKSGDPVRAGTVGGGGVPAATKDVGTPSDNLAPDANTEGEDAQATGEPAACEDQTDCAPGQTCVETEFGLFCQCDPEEEVCDGVDNNCDGVTDEGDLCPEGSLCDDGQCVCEGGVLCGEECVDSSTNSNHCGECDGSCPAQQTCIDGSCSCAESLTACGENCVDLMVDLVHCGECNQICKGGSTCKEGVCTCTGPGSPQLCGSICTDLLMDSAHCGACDATCPEGSTCADGVCLCGEGGAICGDACVQLMTDSLHCGTCNNICGPGSSCVEGECLLPESRLLSPLSGKISTTGIPTFSWEAGPGQIGARIEFCSDSDCTDVIQSHEVGEDSFTPVTPFPVGLMYWRVQPLAPGDLEGPFTAPWNIMIATDAVEPATLWGLVPDIDMDGNADLAIGACGLGDTCSQESWIYHGPVIPGEEPEQILSGAATTLFGYATSLVGDLNGDGRADLAVGSWLTYNIWVYLSQEDGSYSDYTMLEASPGLFPMFGHDVAPAGDINQDGYADLITGDPIQSVGYIYFGGPSGVSPDNSLTLYAGTGGGITVTGGCDINGDGRDDAFVGGPPSLAVFATPDSSEATQILEKEGGNFGIAVDCAGDTNGDGFLDVIVGAASNNGTFVYFGGPDGLALESEIVLEGGNNLGLAVAGIGDINHDGFDDVAIGGGGFVQVHLGSPEGIQPIHAQKFVGEHPSFGTAVIGARDLTGNGWSDLIIGSPGTGITTIHEGSSDGFLEGEALNGIEQGGLGNSLGMALP